MTRSTPRGPQPRHGDIDRQLDDDQLLYLATGQHYFPLEEKPFTSKAMAKKAWQLHRDAVKAWSLRQYGPRIIWAEQQFDQGE